MLNILLFSMCLFTDFPDSDVASPLSKWTWDKIIEKRKKKNIIAVYMYSFGWNKDTEEVFESVARTLGEKIHFFTFAYGEGRSIAKRYGFHQSDRPRIIVFKGQRHHSLDIPGFEYQVILDELAKYIKPCFDYYKPSWLSENKKTALYLNRNESVQAEFKLMSCEYDDIIRFNHTINAEILPRLTNTDSVLILQNETMTSIIESPNNISQLTIDFHIEKKPNNQIIPSIQPIRDTSDLCNGSVPFCVYGNLERADIEMISARNKFLNIPFLIGRNEWESKYEVLTRGKYYLISNDSLSYRAIKPNEYLKDIIENYLNNTSHSLDSFSSSIKKENSTLTKNLTSNEYNTLGWNLFDKQTNKNDDKIINQNLNIEDMREKKANTKNELGREFIGEAI